MTPDDPAPLHTYYEDTELHFANLDDFDPSVRLDASRNGGEASVYLSGLHVLGGGQLAADLAPGGLAAQQAAEVGVSHAGLLRNLVNAALLRSHRELEERQEAAAAAVVKPSKRGRKKKNAAADGGAAAFATSSQEGESGSESDAEESAYGALNASAFPPQLDPLKPLDVYSGAPLLPVVPDSWDLLQVRRHP